MIRRRPLAVYRVIDEDELLGGELLPADGVELSPEWAARLAPSARIARLSALRRLAPLAAVLALAIAALVLVAARWAPGTAGAGAPVRSVVLSLAGGGAPVAHAGRRRRVAAVHAVTDRPRVATRVVAGTRLPERRPARTRERSSHRARPHRLAARVRRASRLAVTPPPPSALAAPTPVVHPPSAPVTRTPITQPAASPATEFGFER